MDHLLLQVRTLYFCIFVHASQYYQFGGLKSSNSVGDPHVERQATASNTYGLSCHLASTRYLRGTPKAH